MPFLTRLISAALVLLMALSIGVTALADEPEIGVYEGYKAPDFSLPNLDGGDHVVLYDELEKYDVVILFFFYAAT
jgi:hypothetical protein